MRSASPGVSIEATIVPRLGAALATSHQRLVLVLDDLHLLDDPAGRDAVAALARHVPEGSQLVLSARGAPALPLGALRARGLTLEIGPDDLRMDARQRLTSSCVPPALTCPTTEVVELTERTEGWSAGLYLAALSIRARGAKARDAAAFSGSDRLVSDYLESELLEHLSPDELRFLTRTAVLERMSGPLCDAVLEETGSAAMLESAGALQPLPGSARCPWALVPLPPSLPGAAPFGSGARRARPDARAARSCGRLV